MDAWSLYSMRAIIYWKKIEEDVYNSILPMSTNSKHISQFWVAWALIHMHICYFNSTICGAAVHGCLSWEYVFFVAITFLLLISFVMGKGQ